MCVNVEHKLNTYIFRFTKTNRVKAKHRKSEHWLNIALEAGQKARGFFHVLISEQTLLWFGI
jgi:hypothetical protein